jgi:hypothetical protein
MKLAEHSGTKRGNIQNGKINEPETNGKKKYQTMEKHKLI